MIKRFKSIYYSFPLQLLLFHIRSHHLLLMMWATFALLISGGIGAKLGLQYLFLDPEYFGNVDFWSFFFLGLAFGGFTMTWNLTTYLLCAHLFPFLATLSRPFTKFCLNNLLIPVGLFLFYLAYIIYFQTTFESWGFEIIFLNCLGLLTGAFSLILLNFFYFHFTNKDISFYHKRSAQPPNLTKTITPGRRDVDLDYIKLDRRRWRVDTYLNESLFPRRVRSVAHYETKLLMNIFKQNHLNALIIQLLSMFMLIVLGRLIDYPFFRIPAAASLFILASVIIAVVGAFIYWFHQWWLTLFVLTLLLINFLTSFDILNHKNKAYGLDYETAPAIYAVDSLQSICYSDQWEKDVDNTIAILDNWRRRARTIQRPKPPMVILCVSGGGLRSATWAMQVTQTADSLLNGRLLDHTVLITGASGGMMGMAYLRELYLREQLGQEVDVHHKKYIDKVAKDLLNPLAFTIVSNDLFLPWGKFERAGFTYKKDRGYILEKQFNENTDYFLDKSLGSYRKPEREAIIPMLYITPSIVNDARRMVISPQGVSFMMRASASFPLPENMQVDAVDFGRLLRRQNADSLSMLSAIRMNATYPYVLPTVHLPTKPVLTLVDAGFRDNYGILSATRFIQVFKEWILENTAGVVLIQISSSQKDDKIPSSERQGMISNLLNPLGIAGQIIDLQEFEQDNNLGFVYDLLGKNKLTVLRFFYKPNEAVNKWEAAISFHLTDGEKENVLQSIYSDENKLNLELLVDALQ